jgi:hypothetical protein
VKANLFDGSIVDAKPGDIVAWAEEHVCFPGSVRSERFKASISPWLILPLLCVADFITRIITFVKPVQSGGSRLGLIALCWWSKFGRGQIQYNWDRDKKASKKWIEETRNTLASCSALEPVDGWDDMRCRATFKHAWVVSQGVWAEGNLDSDSIPYQVNEEVHCWEPGHLAKARGRQTAVIGPKAVDISNAGNDGDQLHRALVEGTCERWEVLCPGCGKYHVMRTRWQPDRPDLGGLRYDSDGCRGADGRINYNRLEKTLRYQMPCGYSVRDGIRERKHLSQTGRYGPAENSGAHLGHRSFTLEAVSCDFISWLTLVQEKHFSLNALKLGDSEPWKTYLKERECVFWKHTDRPFQAAIVLSNALMAEAEKIEWVTRFAFLDYHAGSPANDIPPHWWLMVAGVSKDGEAMPLHECKCKVDEAPAIIARFNVNPWQVCCDSGDESKTVYEFCLRHGYNASKGEGASIGAVRWFNHPDGTRRIFSDAESDFVCERAGAEPHCRRRKDESEDDFEARLLVEEPRYILYSKEGFYDRLEWMITTGRWKHPADASESYRLQMKSWEKVRRQKPPTGEWTTSWKQLHEADHLWACAAGIVMQMEIGDFVGQTAEEGEAE